ncbi:uncharacterized protein [Anabrus simplex]|uniref:uncharacterized protein n=1 Tax=Anabrus simplex TaxID=316456 RepID=UPI0034DD7DDA
MMEIMSFHTNPGLAHQCVVCSSDSINSYVDLSLITSRTSHSNTPVKEKLQNIICDHWISSETDLSFIMCLPCFQLVDQFDALEIQLKAIKNDLCEKYISSHGNRIQHPGLDQDFIRVEKNNPGRLSSGTRGKRVNTTPKRKSPVRRRKSTAENNNVQQEQSQSVQVGDSKKNKLPDNNMLHWQQSPITTFEAEIQHLPDLPGPSQLTGVVGEPIVSTGSVWTNSENGTDMLVEDGKPQTQTVVPLSDVLEEEDLPISKIIYDDDPNFLGPGERLRVGITGIGEGNIISYNCCYCADLFVDAETLKAHVHSRHRPEILTTQVPPHLGLGSKLNCGVQLSNVTAVSELGKPFACLFCDGAFKFKSNIHLHYKEKHTPYKPFTCVDCQESFRRSMELSRHRVYYCPHRKKARPEKRGK